MGRLPRDTVLQQFESVGLIQYRDAAASIRCLVPHCRHPHIEDAAFCAKRCFEGGLRSLVVGSLMPAMGRVVAAVGGNGSGGQVAGGTADNGHQLVRAVGIKGLGQDAGHA